LKCATVVTLITDSV